MRTTDFKEVIMKKDNYFYLAMKTHHLNVPYLTEKRRIRVLLPRDYEKDLTINYPVIYFHDGQNVFHSRESFSGQSWKAIPAIKRNPSLPKMILVGIDNDGENRMNEYTPWRLTETSLPKEIQLGGKGYEYADFVMNVVKPFVDQTYRTKADKKHTAMIGSSLGGNISSFMGIEYKDQIGGLGIFSLANWISQSAFDNYLAQKELDLNQRIYIQVGTEEGDDTDRKLMYGNMKQAYIDGSLTYARQLIEKGHPIKNIDLNIYADEKHNESAWAKHLPECLKFLSKEW